MELLDKIDKFMTDGSASNDIIESVLDFMSLIDMGSLNEEQIEKIDVIFDSIESNEMLSEKMKRVVRGGKKQKKKVCKSGYKAVGGKCVKMSSQEKRSRSKGAKRGAKKKKGKSSSITRKKKKSMKRR